MTTYIEVTVNAVKYEDFDDCLSAAAADYARANGLEDWQVSARWEDDQREAIVLSVPAPTIPDDDFVVARSDDGRGGWSLHAPGSTDDDIASGEAPYLVTGEAELVDGEWSRPDSADYAAARASLARGH